VLSFFNDRNVNPKTITEQSFLAVASEKGNVYIYKLLDALRCDGGILQTQFNRQDNGATAASHIVRLRSKPRQTYVKEKLKEIVNGILCMEFHKEVAIRDVLYNFL
jgi:hypothetical protein